MRENSGQHHSAEEALGCQALRLYGNLRGSVIQQDRERERENTHQPSTRWKWKEKDDQHRFSHNGFYYDFLVRQCISRFSSCRRVLKIADRRRTESDFNDCTTYMATAKLSKFILNIHWLWYTRRTPTGQARERENESAAYVDFVRLNINRRCILYISIFLERDSAATVSTPWTCLF